MDAAATSLGPIALSLYELTSLAPVGKSSGMATAIFATFAFHVCLNFYYSPSI